MAYENQISITITAADEASAVIEDLQKQLEDFQTGVTTAMNEATDAVSGFSTEVESTTSTVEASLEAQQTAWEDYASGVQEQTTAIDESVSSMAESMYTSLGSTAEDYQSNMEIIAEATQGAIGDITILGSTAEETNAAIIASNQDVILSYQEVQAQIGKTELSAASGAGLTDGAAGGAASAVGLGGVSGIMSAAATPVGVAAIAEVLAVKMAGDFQQQVTRLYTTAGETANQSQLTQGIQEISNLTGLSVTQLTSGTGSQPGAMYNISSAGFNQINGLDILRAAAEAAKAEGANPGDVANALTTAMVDYGASPDQATSYMNMLLKSVAEGKTTLQQESTALPTVLTTGATAGLSLPQVLGSLGTLTAAGVSSDQSAQDLSAMSKELAGHFTQPEISALTNYGLNPTTIAQNFGNLGLTGTVDEIMSAMMKSKTPEGLIMQQTFQSSQIADANLQRMISSAPAAVKALARQMEAGTPYYTLRQESQKDLSSSDRNLFNQIETEYNKANSFNSLLAGNQPGSQTVLTALGQVFGQSDVAQAAEILYQHKDKAAANVAGVEGAGKQHGQDISGWNQVTSNFNTQVSQMWQRMQTLMRDSGSLLLPVLTVIAGQLNRYLQDVINWASDVQNIVKNIPKYWSDMVTGIEGFLNQGLTDISKWGQQIGTDISNAFNRATRDAAQWGNDVTTAISNGLSNAGKAVTGFGKSLATDASHWWNDVTSSLSSFTDNLVNWAEKAVSNVVDSFTKIPGKVGSALSSSGSSFVHDIGHDLHIPGFALGTNYAPGGLSLVGESGPELVNLPGGSQVYPTSETAAMLSRDGGKQVVIQQLNINNNVDAGMVIRQLGWQLANA